MCRCRHGNGDSEPSDAESSENDHDDFCDAESGEHENESHDNVVDDDLVSLVSSHMQDEKDELRRSLRYKRVYCQSRTMHEHKKKLQWCLKAGYKKIKV